MADKKMTFGIGIKTTYDASGINKLKADLTNLSTLGKNVEILGGKSSVEEISKAVTAANTLKNALNQAYNPKLGTVTFNRFNEAIKQSGTTVSQLKTDMHSFGTAGDKAFLDCTTSLMKMSTVARSTHTVLDKMFTTFKNTITWGLSSAIWNGITGSLQKTYSYIKDLDTALNDIRIVTGKSNEEMAQFAKNANEAAKALGTTTRNYTEGSLIYYQQGLNDEEVKTRTDITAKTALVTGQSMDQVSEQLTAVWNGYKVSAEEAELYVDRLAAVAATTASNLEELSTGMSKVASAAANLGVSESQLSAILATTISVTRQAPENVGTAYKTIFARISDIQAGLDAETTLGNYTGKMAEMGVNVLDATGNLRDMGEVIEEIGQKWATMSREQQISLAHTMAGTRQYNNLVALFDNWDKYVETLNTANNAAGTLAEQHGIALDSIKNRLNVLKATWEDLYNNLIDSEDIKKIITNLTSLVQVLANLVEGLGGLKNILPIVTGFLLQLAAPKIGQELGSYINSLQSMNQLRHQFALEQEAIKQDLMGQLGGQDSSALDTALNRISERYSTLLSYNKYMTEEEKHGVDALIEQEKELGKIQIDLEKNKQILQSTNLSVADSKTGLGLANSLGYGADIENIQKLISEGSRLKAFGHDIKDMLYDDFGSANGDIGKELENFKNQFIGIANDADLPIEAINRFKEEIDNLDLEFTKEGELTKQSAKDFENFALTVENAGQSLVKMGTDMESVKTSTEHCDEAFKIMKESLDIRAIISDVTQLSGVFSSLAFSIQGIYNLINVLKDENLSMGEKTLRILTTIGFLLPSIMKSFSSIVEMVKKYKEIKAATLASEQTTMTVLLTAEQKRAMAVEAAALAEAAKTKEMERQALLAKTSYAVEEYAQIGSQLKNPALTVAEKGALMSRQRELNETIKANLVQSNNLATEASLLNTQSGQLTNQINKGVVPAEAGAAGAGAGMTKGGGLIGLIAANPTIAATIAGIAIALGAIVATMAIIENQQKKETQRNLQELKTIKESNETRKEQVDKLNEVCDSYKNLKTQLDENKITETEYRNQVLALTEGIEDQSVKLQMLRGDYEDLGRTMQDLMSKQNEELIQGYDKEIEKAKSTMTAAKVQGTSLGQDLWKAITGGNGGLSFIPGYGTVATVGGFVKGLGKDNQVISKSTDLSANTEFKKYVAENENLKQFLDTRGPGGYKLHIEDEDIIKAYEAIDKAIVDNAHLANTETIKELTTIRDNMEEAYEIQKEAQESRDALQKQNIIYDFTKNTDAIKTAEDYASLVSSVTQAALDKSLFGEEGDSYVKARTWANGALSAISDEAIQWSKKEAVMDSLLNSIDTSEWSQTEIEKLLSFFDEYSEEELRLILPVFFTLGENSAKQYAEGYKEGIDKFLGEQSNLVEIQRQALQKNQISSAISLANEKGTFNNEEVKNLLKDIDLNKEDIDFWSLNYGNQMLTSLWTQGQMGLTPEQAEALREGYRQQLDEAETILKEEKEKSFEGFENDNWLDEDILGPLVESQYADIEKKDIEELAEIYALAGNGTKDFTEEQKELWEALVQAGTVRTEEIKAVFKETNSYKKAQENVDALTAAINNVKEGQQDWATVQTQSQKVLDNYNSLLDEVQSAYKTLSTAEEEWNLNEGFTVDTLQNLLKMNPMYIEALEVEGNQFKVNTERLNDVAQAEAVAAVNAAELARISAYQKAIDSGRAEDVINLTNTLDNLAGEIKDVTSANWEMVRSSTEAAFGLNSEAYAAVEAASKMEAAYFEKARHIASNVDLTKDNKKSGKSSKKDTKEYRDEFDRYWEYLKAIDKVAEAIDKLNKKEKNLYGTQKIASLKNKNDLLKQQVGTYNDLYEEQKREQAELIGSLGAQGMTFNAEGEITNYAKKTSEALAAYNDAVRAYNAGTLSETAFDTAEKEYEKFKKEVERYDKLYYSEMKDTIEKVEDINREVLANNLEAWEIEIKLKLDWSSLEREWADFLHNIEKDFTAVYEDLGSELENIIKKATTYTETDGTIETDLKAIKDVMAEIDKIEAGNPSDMFESMTQAQEKLKELNSSLMKDSTALKKLWEDAYKAYLDGIEQLNDKLEDQMDKYEQIDKELAHQQKLIGLLYGDTAYSMMDVLYRNQEKNQLAEIHALKTQRDLWEKNWKAAEEGSKEQLKFYELMIDAQNNLNSSVEEYIKLLQTDLANAVSSTLDKLDKTLTNGLGIDRVKEQWDDLRQYNEGYFDDNQRIFEIEKFGLTVEQKIADANAKNQKSLKAFQEEELKRLKEKQTLSEYDIKTAEYRLELLEKEMALEDAQNAKNSMKLTRDTNGNWTYQYVADEEDVAQKQLDLVKTAENYYNYASEMHDKALEKMMDAFSRYKQTVQEIANDVTLTEEEKNERIAEATKEYEKYTERLMEQSNLTAQDMAATSAYALTLSVKTNLVNINDLSEEQQDIVAKTIELNKQDFESLYGAVEENDRNIMTDIENMLATTVPEWTTAAQEMADKWNADDGNSVKNLVNNAIGEIRTELSEYSMELDELERTADVDFGNITSYIEEATGATEELTDKIDELCNDNDLENLKAIVDDVAESWNNVKGAITDAIREVEIYLKKLGEISNMKVNTLGASAGWSDASNFGGKGSGSGSFETDTEQQWWSIGADGSVIVGNANSTVPFANISKDADTAAKVEWGKHYGNAEFRADRMDLSDSTMRGLAALIGMSTEEATRIYRTPENLITNLKLEERLLQLIGKDGKMSQYLGFATGGYTGDWAGGDGRLALLHSKEIVLNEADTANFLSAVSMIREIASFGNSIEESIMLGINAFMNQFSGGVDSIKGGNNNSKQNIFNINAPITSTATTDEIQNALLQLPNLASQYVSRTNGSF